MTTQEGASSLVHKNTKIGYRPGTDPADPGGNALDDCAVEDGHGEVGTANVVHSGVAAAHVGLRDLDAPEDLDQPEHGDAADHLGDGPHDGLLLGHVALDTRLKVVVRTGRGIA